ncbi:hypothetical protein CHU32_26165 [Superficieibacter electus]|uniref:Uncharacterized protein n=1 Tax=Superficieibacter electus TaxID=2022662 RepID=A0A2P5GHE7_9ENTR|nr:hypothetical protein [Superficieibacter electus]POP40665.1 hypothetical protein CHU33_26250 [Superficieibacter electus]POP41829.1 hypothetical protein CHU32_26165 [Superficieibacter electus]
MSEIIFDDGFDCMWLASDKDGCLAVFFSAGQGPLPAEAAKNEKLSLDDIENEVYKLPYFSDIDLHVSVKRPDDFIEMSKRGFFVYDWRDIVRTIEASSNLYELVSSPKCPITICDLPEPLLGMAKSVVFSQISFSQMRKIDIDNLR